MTFIKIIYIYLFFYDFYIFETQLKYININNII